MSTARRAARSLRLLFLVLGAFQLAPAWATMVYLDPAVPTVGVNSNFQVDLDISGANNSTVPPVAAFDVTLSFNPALVGFQSATFGNQIDISGLGDIQSVTPGNGSVEVYEVSLDSATALSAQASNFTLATFSLYSIAAGTSALSVTLNGLSDPNGNPIAAMVNSGSVNIQSSPVPLSPSIIFLFSGIVGGWIFAQRRPLIACQ